MKNSEFYRRRVYATIITVQTNLCKCKTMRRVCLCANLLTFTVMLSVCPDLYAQEPLVTITTTDDANYEGAISFSISGNEEDFSSLRIDAGYGKKLASEVDENGEIPLKGNIIKIYGKIEGLVAPMGRTHNVTFAENDFIKKLSFALNELPSGIDLSANKMLEYVSFLSCGIQSLDFSKLPSTLKTIYLTTNNLSSVDFSRFHDLETVYIDENPLISFVDFTTNKNLQRINISGNPLITSVNLTEQKNLAIFEAWNCNLTDIDFSHTNVLENVSLSNNKLDSIIFGNTDNLQILDITSNNIKNLETSKMPAMLSLSVIANKEMETLDVSKCEKLVRLNIDSTRISRLNLANCLCLEILTASETLLKELDLSNNKNLSQLSIENCKAFTDLNVSDKPNLRVLIMAGNKLGWNITSKIATDLPKLINDFGTWGVILNTSTEQNQISKESVNIAKSKGWDIVARNSNGDIEEYEGMNTGVKKIMTSKTKQLQVTVSENNIDVENLPKGYQKKVNIFDAKGRKIRSIVTDKTSIRIENQSIPKGLIVVECNGVTEKGIIR